MKRQLDIFISERLAMVGKRLVLLTIGPLAMACTGVRMAENDTTVLSFVRLLASGGVVDRATIESKAGAKSRLVSSDYIDVYELGPLTFSDAVVKRLEIRELKDKPPIVALDITGCVTKDQVLREIPNLTAEAQTVEAIASGRFALSGAYEQVDVTAQFLPNGCLQTLGMRART